MVRRGKAPVRRETGMREKAVYGVLERGTRARVPTLAPIAQGGNKGLWRLGLDFPLQDQGLLKRSAVLGALTPSGEHTDQRPRRPNRQPYWPLGTLEANRSVASA